MGDADDSSMRANCRKWRIDSAFDTSETLVDSAFDTSDGAGDRRSVWPESDAVAFAFRNGLYAPKAYADELIAVRGEESDFEADEAGRAMTMPESSEAATLSDSTPP